MFNIARYSCHSMMTNTDKTTNAFLNAMDCFAWCICWFGLLASTFKVLTWRIMPNAGEAEVGGPDGSCYAN